MAEVLPLAILADVTLGKMVQPSRKHPDEEYRPYLRAAHIQANGRLDLSVEPKEMWFSPDEQRLYELHAGDVLLVEGGAVGRSAFLPQDLPGLGFQNALLRLRPIAGTDGRYLDYCLQSAVASGEIDALCASVSIAHFTAEKVGRFRIPYSPSERQRAIADYLDRETGEIDAMIAKMDELTETLHARTAAFKASELLRAKERRGLRWVVSEINTGPFGTQVKQDEYVTDGVPLINPSHIAGGRIVPDPKVSVSLSKAGELRRFELRAGDVVVARRGELGRAAVVQEGDLPALCGTGSLRVRPDHGLALPEYVHLVVSSHEAVRELEQLSVGATMGNLNERLLGEVYAPVLTVSEQRRLLAHVDEVTGKIDTMLAKVAELKSLLIERRAALITDVVTGRKAVA